VTPGRPRGGFPAKASWAALAAALFLSGCVIPWYDELDHIVAVPRSNLYPVNYAYDPVEEIIVEAVSAMGETSRIPVTQTRVTAASVTGEAAPTDFSKADRKRITVTYQGKSDYFYLDIGDGSGGSTPGTPVNPPGLIVIIQ
jgi:hypothetical protein